MYIIEFQVILTLFQNRILVIEAVTSTGGVATSAAGLANASAQHAQHAAYLEIRG